MKDKLYITALLVIILGLFFSCQTPLEESSNRDESNRDERIKETGNYEKAEVLIKIANTTLLSVVDGLVPGERIKIVTKFNGYTYVLYKLNGSKPLDTVLKILNGNANITIAEENYRYTHFVIPNDTYYNYYQYAPQITDSETAWDTTTGDSSIIVAVLDTGINGQHEDFGSGRVIAGYDFVNSIAINAGVNSDDHGHGTHVAGIIGATGDNSVGIAGVAWQTTLMPVKVLDYDGGGWISDIVAGGVWAVDNGADVINMSLGGPYYSQIAADAINYALENGVVIVVAMGNDGISQINYSAGNSGVIAVGSTNGRDEISGYSTFGNHISVSAPGENIYSSDAFDNSGYVYMSGTSMATPFVSGVVALLLANDANLTPAEVKSIIEDSSIDLGTAGFDTVFGYGRVDANSALSTTTTNNYGTIKVQVNNNASPVSGVEVLLLNSSGTSTIKTALTSDGTGDGGVNGEASFPFTHSGSYVISVCFGNVTQTAIVNLSAEASVTETFNFNITPPKTYIIETFANGGSPDADTYLFLSDISLTLIASDDDGGLDFYSYLEHELTSGETYYILIWDYWYDPGYYSIMVSESGGGNSIITPTTGAGEPDDDYTSATVMSLDTIYDRYLSYDEEDWFVITIP